MLTITESSGVSLPVAALRRPTAISKFLSDRKRLPRLPWEEHTQSARMSFFLSQPPPCAAFRMPAPVSFFFEATRAVRNAYYFLAVFREGSNVKFSWQAIHPKVLKKDRGQNLDASKDVPKKSNRPHPYE